MMTTKSTELTAAFERISGENMAAKSNMLRFMFIVSYRVVRRLSHIQIS